MTDLVTRLSRNGRARAVVLLVLCSLAAYHNSFGNSFHYDDSHSLVDNFHVRSLGNVHGFFADPGMFSAMPESRMYRPVLLVSYALNYAVGEYDVRGYHLVNFLLHVLNAWLVRELARRFLATYTAWLGGTCQTAPGTARAGRHCRVAARAGNAPSGLSHYSSERSSRIGSQGRWVCAWSPSSPVDAKSISTVDSDRGDFSSGQRCRRCAKRGSPIRAGCSR